ncbi:hypothetical protein OHS70_22335 [Streptomyces sp. NBC_00390]|uniref:hypothetical protein n=1 Tax=Streptomyces sp. NBC_00390 TaxID=2975736 RepID=UPI002E24D107
MRDDSPRRRPPAALRSTAPRSTALCSVAALALTACGPVIGEDRAERTAPAGPFAGLSGPEIAERSVQATKEASSLTLDVDFTTEDGPLKAYMATGKDGKCAGTLSVGSTGTAELIKIGGAAYLRFDEAFLREELKGEPAAEAQATLKLLKGRWVRTDASDEEAAEELELCDLDRLLGDIETNDTEARRGRQTTVDGRKALMLTETDGDATYTMYVATEGKPYLLRIDQKGGDDPGTITFSDFDKPVVAKKPADKDIFELPE